MPSIVDKIIENMEYFPEQWALDGYRMTRKGVSIHLATGGVCVDDSFYLDPSWLETRRLRKACRALFEEKIEELLYL